MAAAAVVVLFAAGVLVGRGLFAQPPGNGNVTTRLLQAMSADARSNRDLTDVEDSRFTYSNVSFRRLDAGRVALDFDVATHVQVVESMQSELVRDVLVHSPDDRAIFTGDILFIDGHPILWAGPVRNWIAACHRIESLDVDTVVPGHGPITDKRGVIAVREYLEYVTSEARARYDAGMDPLEAAMQAVHVHGRAGDLAAAAMGEAPMIATDLVANLPAAVVELTAPSRHRSRRAGSERRK